MIKVYAIKSSKNGRTYIGQTNNLDRRLIEHNAGMTKSIRYFAPFELVYFENYSDRIAAMKREKYLKSGQGRSWLKEELASGRQRRP